MACKLCFKTAVSTCLLYSWRNQQLESYGPFSLTCRSLGGSCKALLLAAKALLLVNMILILMSLHVVRASQRAYPQSAAQNLLCPAPAQRNLQLHVLKTVETHSDRVDDHAEPSTVKQFVTEA